MDDEELGGFKCYLHEVPLDETWQCPEAECRAAHCPICGRYEQDRCEHLFYTDGEWVYYAPDGLNSEDFPGGGFEEFGETVLLEAFGDEPELAVRLSQGQDPLRALCDLAVQRMEGSTLVSLAGGWWPGSDSWSNTWVSDMPEVLGKFRPLMECYLAGLRYLEDVEENEKSGR